MATTTSLAIPIEQETNELLDFPQGGHENHMKLISSEEKATALFLLLDLGRKRNVVKVQVSDTSRTVRGGASLFTIDIKVGDTKGWSVTRQYKDFKQLQRTLKSHRFPCPQLPSRKIFKVRSKGFLRKRQGALDLWLQGTCCIWQSLYGSESDVSASQMEITCNPINRAVVDFLTLPAPDAKPRSSRYLESLMGSPARSSTFVPSSPLNSLSLSLSKASPILGPSSLTRTNSSSSSRASPLGPSAIRRSISLPKLTLPWNALHSHQKTNAAALNTVLEHTPTTQDELPPKTRKTRGLLASALNTSTTALLRKEQSLKVATRNNIDAAKLSCHANPASNEAPCHAPDPSESDGASHEDDDSSYHSSCSERLPCSPAAALVPRRRAQEASSTPVRRGPVASATVHDTIQFTFSGSGQELSPSFADDEIFEYEDEEPESMRGDNYLKQSEVGGGAEFEEAEEEEEAIPFAISVVEKKVPGRPRSSFHQSRGHGTQWTLFDVAVVVDEHCHLDLVERSVAEAQSTVAQHLAMSAIPQEPTSHDVACYTPVSIPPTPGGFAVFNESWHTYTTSLLGYVSEHLVGLEEQPASSDSAVSNAASHSPGTAVSSPSSSLATSTSNTDLCGLQTGAMNPEDDKSTPQEDTSYSHCWEEEPVHSARSRALSKQETRCAPTERLKQGSRLRSQSDVQVELLARGFSSNVSPRRAPQRSRADSRRFSMSIPISIE